MYQSGFTLMELMIVLAIVAILGAIAFPSYSAYVLRGKRAEGRSFLMDTAAKQERYYSDCNRFGSTISGANNCGTGAIKLSGTSDTGLYNLTISNLGASNQTFTLTAAPTFTDAECGSLTLDQAGTKGRSGTKNLNDCWGK